MTSRPYKRYLLILLTSILVFNYLDRMALGIVMQDIKEDLSLSDTQLGLLSGIAFAIFYSVMGIPIARWADRGNRVTIITITTALWSVMVALCGAVGSFVQLLFVRIGVAVGEAGCTPPAFTLIADYFNRAERPRASAIYGLGGPLSVLIGYSLAGWLNEIYGWRVTFVLLGLPGLVLALLAWFTLREPRQLRAAAPQQSVRAPAQGVSVTPTSVPPNLKETLVTLWSIRTYRHLLLCLSATFFFLYGIGQWLPTFFIRSYALSGGELGLWLALMVGAGSFAGSYLGGELASRYAPQNEQRQLKGLSITLVCSAALSVGAYLSHQLYGSLGLMGLSYLFLTLVNGPLFATVQTLVPDRMRAVAIALLYLCANLIGMGLGPLAAGALSDALYASQGEESLRYALVILSPGFLWAAWHIWRASRSAAGDIAAAIAREHNRNDTLRAADKIKPGTGHG